ncbi:MAG TPA: signal peptidase I, partial [Chloroflexota bacterium]|nr:signal peptidase I [Chloroflexota bacterium]
VVGDVVTYTPVDQPNVLVTHRVVLIATDPAGRRTFTTRGDANDAADASPVAAEAIVGRVVGNLPSAGYLEDFTKRPFGHFLILGIPALLLYLDYAFDIRRSKSANPQLHPDIAESLVAQGQVELEWGGPRAALVYLDQAIVLNPRLDHAWVVKARCAATSVERLAILRSGLTINPASSPLRQAIHDEENTNSRHETGSGASAG